MASKKPSKTRIEIRGQVDKGRAIKLLSEVAPDPQKPVTFTLDEAQEGRREKQNRLAFLWYKEMHQQKGGAKFEWRRLCKLQFGVPILREDPEVNAMMTRILDPLPYESQLEAMDYMEVTRLFDVGEFAEYLNDIDMYSSVMQIKLTHPDDLYWDALMKEAERRYD